MKSINILGISVLLLAHSLSNGGERPDILFVMADDASRHYYGTYNPNGSDPGAPTPNLDRIAAEGVQFTKAFATSMCGPTRYLLLTGKFARETGGYHNRFDRFPNLNNDINRHFTLAEMWKASGYATAFSGKWGVEGTPDHFDSVLAWEPGYFGEAIERDGTNSVGSRYWNPALSLNGQIVDTEPTDFGPDLFTNHLLGFLDHDDETPLALFYSMVAPHAERGRIYPCTPVRTSNGNRQRYRNLIEYSDTLFGILLDRIQERGRPYLVIFCSDNPTPGEGKQETTLRGCNVPMVIAGTAIHPRGTVSNLLSFADLLPTLAAFAGYETPFICDGVDLSGFLRGEIPYTRGEIYSQIGGGQVYFRESGRHKIENRDFILGNGFGDYRRDGQRIYSKTPAYLDLIRYGHQINGPPLKESSAIFDSQPGRNFLRFWKNRAK